MTADGNAFEPLRGRRTFEEISDRLKRMILDGILKPGEQLPTENELARLFDVGRQSVREALRVLEISGFIVTKPGAKGGAIIERTMLSRMTGLFGDVFKFHRVSIEDCVAARKAIETTILRSVLEKADDTDIENLRANISEAKAKLKATNLAFEENIEFHRILARGSKNYAFSIVMESLLAIFYEIKGSARTIELAQSLKVIELHEGIVDAVADRNTGKAIELLEQDLTVGQEILIAVKAAERPAE